jgi:cobalt-zinc-cadmium efflux system outer membrane protein
MKLKLYTSCIGIWLILSSVTAANTPARGLTLQQALKYTLESNPELKARELSIKSRKASIRQASLLPNPELEIELEDFGRAEGSVMFSQLIELGGKRAGRIEMAKSEEGIALLEFEILRMDLLTETAVRFVSLWEAQEKLKYWHESVSIADSMVSIIEHRVTEGASPEVDKIRSQVELANIKLKAEAAGNTVLTAKSALSALWGDGAHTFIQ